MISEADRAVLDESYRNIQRGREAIHVVLGKVEDEDLALDFNRQICRFVQLEEKLQKKYQQEKERPPEASVVSRTKLWGDIQVNTLLNASTDHLASLIIRENTRGITDLMKKVKKNKGMQKEYYEFAQNLMDFEEKNIEKLKAYLK